ncbi:hypothetical protein [Laspinema olomoucense]|uniref:Uncharacterized protein n=1 Tax=Laspinema olomoucense D3b TaxID=2953688 RepID=A0ABT2N7I7_9CYAN|nr:MULTISPECIES: hypothetical protein [unclassified Laspinema]MCT7975987.1 hypothetical protein [Laspinema sp. D3d]MCT7978652.1 hypothetical protein [Laspinema sp. D3b]MCT7989403.1 hypothetical protein [Laspinema sp. D3a]MCT7992316.1 hypothetical protein [Laspinema sp. D3c]
MTNYPYNYKLLEHQTTRRGGQTASAKHQRSPPLVRLATFFRKLDESSSLGAIAWESLNNN